MKPSVGCTGSSSRRFFQSPGDGILNPLGGDPFSKPKGEEETKGSKLILRNSQRTPKKYPHVFSRDGMTHGSLLEAVTKEILANERY